MEECAEELSRKLSLTEKEEEGVVFEEEEVRVTIEDGDRCLVGKILSHRPFGRDVVNETMAAAWGLWDRIKCKPIGTNMFFFQFRSRGEMLKVWYGGPWHLDNNMLVLEKFNGELRPSKYKFQKAPFWIQVEDPPQKFMSENCAKIIGNYCGRFLDWDKGKDDIVWGRRLRIRVEVDVNEPLLRGIKLRSVEGGSVWVDFIMKSFQFSVGGAEKLGISWQIVLEEWRVLIRRLGILRISEHWSQEEDGLVSPHLRIVILYIQRVPLTRKQVDPRRRRAKPDSVDEIS